MYGAGSSGGSQGRGETVLTHSIFASLELLPNLPFPVMVMSMGVEDTDQVPGSSNPWGGETGSKAGHRWALSLPCQSSSLQPGPWEAQMHSGWTLCSGVQAPPWTNPSPRSRLPTPPWSPTGRIALGSRGIGSLCPHPTGTALHGGRLEPRVGARKLEREREELRAEGWRQRGHGTKRPWTRKIRTRNRTQE